MFGHWRRKKVRKLGRKRRVKKAMLFGHWGKGKEQREGEKGKGVERKGEKGLKGKVELRGRVWGRKEGKGEREEGEEFGEERTMLFGHDLLVYGLRLRLSALSV